MLHEIEDRLLALSEGDQVTISLAQKILGSWFELKLKRSHVTHMARRLSNLKLVQWHYVSGRKHYRSYYLPRSRGDLKQITFRASPAGERLLAQSEQSVSFTAS